MSFYSGRKLKKYRNFLRFEDLLPPKYLIYDKQFFYIIFSYYIMVLFLHKIVLSEINYFVIELYYFNSFTFIEINI